ncbi:hypothetical protein O1M54_25960 [Streptomyces diastatochromogenes]|nr:hypothetical protein [Streptomyces diastatochromogenes]
MNLFLALASAMVLGSADFVGGLATKHARAAVVVCWSNTAGLLTALVFAGILSHGGTSWSEAVWGGLAGLCGSLGAILLYHALANGVMSLVAPTTAAAAAALPVIAGVLSGDRLTGLAVIGVLCALPRSCWCPCRATTPTARPTGARWPAAWGSPCWPAPASGCSSYCWPTPRATPACGRWCGPAAPR